MKRLILALIVSAAFAISVLPVWAWDMVGRDAQHTNSIPDGPSAPLRKAWSASPKLPESNFTTWPVVDGGVVYARSGAGVLAVEAESGTTIWFETEEEGAVQVAPSLDSDRLYISKPSGSFVALDRRDGDEVWRYESGVRLAVSSTLAGELVFFAAQEAKTLFAVNRETGTLVWKVKTRFEPDSIPAVSEGVLVFSTDDIESAEVEVIALHAATGEELWRLEQKEANSSPSILEGRVILGGGDFFAYALDVKTGEKLWKSPVEGKFDPRNMPSIAFGDVFLADRIGNIYRLDGETGERKWFFDGDNVKGTLNQSFPVIAGKTLFIGAGSGELYALDVDTGKLLWKDAVRGIVLSGAADSKRFYFGVKLGPDEGLHAYEHDPEGKILSEDGGRPDSRRLLGTLLVAGIALILLVTTAAVFIFVFRLMTRNRRRGESANP